MYGIVVGTCPEYLLTIVEPATPSHPGLRSAACSAPKFVVPRLRTKFNERAFSFSGPVAWNSLPADIRCTTNRQTFKTLLKSHFLIFHSYCCLLLGAHVLIVMVALQIYIDVVDSCNVCLLLWTCLSCPLGENPGDATALTPFKACVCCWLWKSYVEVRFFCKRRPNGQNGENWFTTNLFYTKAFLFIGSNFCQPARSV